MPNKANSIIFLFYAAFITQNMAKFRIIAQYYETESFCKEKVYPTLETVWEII